jgi:glycosyltransferase involved in cell wall biosynthesis
MRVLHTAHSYTPDVSGVAEVVGQISKRLASRGHEVHVATRGNKKLPREEFLSGVHIHRFDVSGNAVIGIKGELDRYQHFVKSSSWDILAMHCAQIWSSDALFPILDEIKAKKIFVGHGFSEFLNPKYKRYFRDLAHTLTKTNAMIALSDLLEEKSFCRDNGFPDPLIIPNGVDLAQWNEPSRGLRELWGIGHSPWLLSISNHSPVKGHPALFDVAKQVRRNNKDVVTTIIGGYYAAEKSGLGRFGIKGGCWYRCRISADLSGDVNLRWSVPREAVISAVQEADVILITSLREASPLVVLESAAAGTPWVAFNVGCVRENMGGIVVDSPKEMADTIIKLLSDPEERLALGKIGRKYVEQRHDWESVVSLYEKTYQSVAAAYS